jgi:spermidine/putrescine transport system ATP-binding protein
VRGVTRIFGSGPGRIVALDDVSLTIAPGACFTLLGPSGCDKTALMRMIAGFEAPSVGALLIDGRDVSSGRTGGPSTPSSRATRCSRT